MNRRLTLVFALGCGLTVANLYYVQPLLGEVARQLHAGTGATGLVVTATQAGYVAGLVLLVPLGDLIDRRRLVQRALAGAVVGLVASALAPSVPALAAASVVVGLTSVVAQVLVPFAATLADEASRGRVVGAVMSGLLLGILLARTVSGVVAQFAGWRTVYWVAAGLMALLGLLLRAELPAVAPSGPRHGYGALLRSVLTLVREEPVLRRRSVLGATVFACFSVFWTAAAFLLSRPPYHYSDAVIGLFGLVGAAGAMTAQVAGRLADAGRGRLATGGFLAVVAGSFGLMWAGAHTLGVLIAGIVLLDLGVQGTHILNQATIYRLRPEARSRLTTAYMTSYFAGGTAGSAASAVAYGAAGWPGVCAVGLGVGLVGLGAWAWGAIRGSRATDRVPSAAS